MKRLIASLCLLTLLLANLCSCSYWYATRHPLTKPMTKWVAEDIELYVLEDEKAFIIANYCDTKIMYPVSFSSKFDSQMSIDDMHESYDPRAFKQENPNRYMWRTSFAGFEVNLLKTKKFKLSNHDLNVVPGGGYNIPELMFPQELVFELVETELTEENIPKIEINEQYGFCPKYRLDSEWVSDDLQMTLNIGTLYSNPGVRYQCQIKDDPSTQFHVNFFESNSSAYLTKIADENKSYPHSLSSLTVSQSTEEWKCEYFENYFLATVVRSEYYEPGHVLTFTLLPPSTESETDSTTETTSESATVESTQS